MAWKVNFAPAAERSLAKLDKPVQKRINAFTLLLESATDPRALLEPYSGPLAGYWKKRIGDYRVVCEVNDRELVVLVVKANHRSKIYKA